MTRPKLYPLFIICTLLTGCATGYEPAGEMGGFEYGGYTDQMINYNTAIVTFRGNSSTPRGIVKTYLLYRCAQVTLAHGFDYFILASNSTSSRNVYINTQDTYNSYLTDPPHLYTTYYRSSEYISSHYTASATPGYYPQLYGSTAVIKMFQGNTRGIPGKTYNATDVIAHLGPTTF